MHPCADAEAIFSTYVIGLTDGVTVWALSISRSRVQAIQWPFFTPFEPDFATYSFGQWSGAETASVVRVRSLVAPATQAA